VLAGTLLSARHVLDVVEDATGEKVHEIEFVGRGASDPTWEALALETLGTQVRFHEDAEMSARGAAVLGAIMTGFSLEQASRQLGDRTWTAVPDTADLERGRVLIARYRQASDTALSWLKGTAHGF
jgi:sugar (pentulose or hexulose) kinase